ncbi:DUF6302 family protein [Streptomyces lasiicapitis]|uniref:DUF6302 family protein n=1 Tax=Streptomyces lasiicapitis TaxID=1923961 RepID=UPI00332B5698
MNVVLRDPWEAYDLEYYAQRLAEPELMEESLAVRMMRMPLLAVRVGGTRRGGSYPVPCPCFAWAVRAALQGQPGYPHLRMRWSTRPDAGLLVEWGEEPPTLWPPADDADVGRFYGYSKVAIDQYTARRTQVLTVPPASCSVFLPERPPV